MSHFVDSDIRLIILDIEGTTTSIEFVHSTLFDYARDHLTEYLARESIDPELRKCIGNLEKQRSEDLQAGLYSPDALGRTTTDDNAGLVAYVEWLIRRDSKLLPLKTLQGLIWKDGFSKGVLRGQVYNDVPDALKRWHEQGKTICIYSSGSVLAQKLIFGSSQFGALTQYISGFYDSSVGVKTKSESYRNIAILNQQVPESCTFFSDSVKELNAAIESGMNTCLVCRTNPSEVAAEGHPAIESFSVMIT